MPTSAYQGDGPYVFVCYSHKDSDAVFAEIEWLQNRGINVWFDEGITPGEEWNEELGRAIDRATWLILFLTRNSIESRHCRNEILFASNHDTPILTIYLEDIELPVGLELTLASVQAISGFDLSTENRRGATLDAINRTTGNRVTSLRQHSRSPLQNGARKLFVSVAISALAFAVYTYMDNRSRIAEQLETADGDLQSESTTQISTLAVLPFSNLSGESDFEYFSDGLTEEVLNRLSRIENLRVAARTSSFAFKGNNRNLTEVGKTLGVENVIEGSVRRSGNSIRVTAQLVSTKDGYSRWSETFEKTINNTFAVQDEISREVAKAMQVAFTDTDGVSSTGGTTKNDRAYQLYLMGNQALHRRTRHEVEYAIDLFEEAIEEDPLYAPPLIGLAEAAQVLMNNFAAIPRTDAIRISWRALDNASALGYRTADYWATLGLLHNHLIPDDAANRDRAIEYYEKAIELNPNDVDVLVWYAALLMENVLPPDLSGASRLLDKAVALDPLNRMIQNNRQILLSRQGKDEEAVANLNRLIRIDPEYTGYKSTLGFVHLSNFRLVDAAKLVPIILGETGSAPSFTTYLLNILGDSELMIDFGSKEGRDQITKEIAFTISASNEELIQRAREILSAPDPDQVGRPVAFRLVEMGEHDLAKELLENMDEGLASGDHLKVTTSDIDLLYMQALNGLGDDRAKTMAHTILNQNRGVLRTGIQSKGISDAYCYLILEEMDAAAEEIATAHELGWRGYFFEDLDESPLFRELVQRAEIKEVRRLQRDFLNEKRPQVISYLYEAGLVDAL